VILLATVLKPGESFGIYELLKESFHQFGQILQATVPALVVLVAHVLIGEEFMG
jgi:hypothetical protein